MFPFGDMFWNRLNKSRFTDTYTPSVCRNLYNSSENGGPQVNVFYGNNFINVGIHTNNTFTTSNQGMNTYH